MKIYPIEPVPKPRMTRRDKWKHRPIVDKYFQFRDEVRRLKIDIPESGAWIIFMVPLPKSWSREKKLKMIGSPHLGTKEKTRAMDIDNLIKGLLDAVYGDDSAVWDIKATKLWGYYGSIIVVDEYDPDRDKVNDIIHSLVLHI